MSRSTFYYQLNVLRAGDKYEPLKARIQAIYRDHQGRYGYRRITAALRRLGEKVNHKIVQRLMQQLGLKSKVRVKRYRSYRGPVGKKAPNLLARDFQTASPNTKWATDVTEFKVQGRKLYLSPVMDLFNGEILAYELSERPVLKMVTGMLQKAFSRLKGDAKPVVHSDQGWHYQHPEYCRMLSDQGLVQSMSRKGNCLDNAAMESFFGTLKSEFYYLNRFDSVEQLRHGIEQYIDYYNRHRIRLTLNGLTPVEYREQAATAA